MNLEVIFLTWTELKFLKTSDEYSTSQINIAGSTNTKNGESFKVDYDASKRHLEFENNFGKEIAEFRDTFDFDGIKINIAGKASLGDEFNIEFTDGLSENLNLQLKTAVIWLLVHFIW